MIVICSPHVAMGEWVCGITECGRDFAQPGPLIRHQAVDHGPVECAVCGESVPAGYFGIRHAFRQHNRAEFVRAYAADSGAVRAREELLDFVESNVDVAAVRAQIDASDQAPVASAGD